MRFRSKSICCALGFGLGIHIAAAQTTSRPPLQPSSSEAEEDRQTAELTRALAAVAAGDARDAEPTNDMGPRGIMPFFRGFNSSLAITSQHDSAGGWQSILTPNLAFRFNRHFSVLAGLPIYSYINLYQVTGHTTATKTVPSVDVYGYQRRNFVLGDTDISGQFEHSLRSFDYALTSTLGVPTGEDNHGLGAGQFTYNFNNHFERSFPHGITPDLEMGIGNSPNLVDPAVRKTYVDVGINAHFQLGFTLELPRDLSFTSEAFEELPLSTQTFTSTTTNGKKGKQLRTVTTITNRSVGEDNGFLNTLDIPLNPHIALSAFYNRSLRNKIDTAGFSIIFLFRGQSRSTEHPAK